MKKINFTLCLVLLVAIALTSCTATSNEETYKQVTIGNQSWMSENLNVEKFRNGDPIPEAKTEEDWQKAAENKQPAWCYYDNDSSNGEKYGKLYNWHAVSDPRGLAPEGWHIPKDSEWSLLTNYLEGEDKASQKLKSTSGWKIDGNGTNESGFSGLPGGDREWDGSFNRIGKYAEYWSSTEEIANFAKHYTLDYGAATINIIDKGDGLSVRCIKNDMENNDEISLLKNEYEYIEAEFVDFSMGDFAHYTFKTKNGEEYDFNGIEDSFFDEEADHTGKYFYVFYKSEELVDPEHGPYTSEIIYRIIEESSIAVPVAEFNLISSNKSQSSVTRIPFIADYKIELLIGNTIIDVFEDFGYAYISDDKTYIEISTDAGSNRSYWFELDEFGQLIVTKHYSFSDMDIG